MQPLTVLCWNVLYTNFDCCRGSPGARQHLANVMVNEMRADVAGLQECMNENELQSALGDRMTKAPNTDTFNCIFYKPGMVSFGGVSGHQYLGNDARDDYSDRYVSYAKLLHAGRAFWVFSTHWCLDGPCRGAAGGLRHRTSAQRILQKREELGASDTPTIIAADCNSHMDGYDNDDGVRWLLDNGFQIAGKGPMAGGIDYIFVSTGDWDIGEHIVGPTAPSDHPSFTVKLTMKGGGGGGPVVTTTSTTTTTSTATSTFVMVGGVDRVCRGAGPDDNSAAYFTQHHASTLLECQTLCELTAGCRGIEYSESSERCEVWTRSEGIGATASGRGYVCMRLARPPATYSFTPVDGGKGRACRGADPADNLEMYYSIMGSSSMLHCEAHCVVTVGCVGIEYNDRLQRCEVWTRMEGIGATREASGYNCLRYKRVPPQTDDHYRKAEPPERVGSWGGMCTCPSGRSFNVGDRFDGCANGPASLACEGGVPGECVRQPDPARDGMKVTCGAARPSGSCAGFDIWPDVDGGITCGDCTALVLTEPYGGSCQTYCESFGHVCVAAAEEVSDNCEVKEAKSCEQTIVGTSDMLCSCRYDTVVTG